MLAAALLAIASLVVFYVLVGYPLLLSRSSRRTAAPPRKDPAFRASVSVIIAVYNGGAFIRKKLESLLAMDYPTELLDILIVSDGSSDDTDHIVQEYSGRGVRLVRVPHGGKASAINAGLQHASGEILFFTDVRQFMDPHALSHLVANFADPTVGAATGELRWLNPALGGQQADLELYWRYEIWARARHSAIDSIFNTTGCIYAIRRSLAAPIPPDTLTDDAVIPLRAFFSGYRVIFEPAAIAYDYPTAPGGEFRRKLRTLAGLWQVHTRMPALFTGANRMRFHFLSHKFGRLAMPWAVLVIWIATLALPPSAFREFLVTDELVMAALALLDPYVPRRFFLKRVSSPSRTFLSMNAAALLAPLVFVVRPKILWRPTEVTEVSLGITSNVAE
jgi:cellulose synthase/poly-beta-1,6-N-acetylglucosamine synthase-like glycosyltransferase